MCLEKVTTFITRNKNGKKQLLLFNHPHAGIQIPAGTVEIGERSDDAALREAFEETSLNNLNVVCKIGELKSQLLDDKMCVVENTKIYSRPSIKSFDWASIRRGIKMESNGLTENGFTHITYKEFDDNKKHLYITYQITGWIPNDCISKKILRYLYHLETNDINLDFWENEADNHTFKFFWADVDKLPQIVISQAEWLEYVKNQIGYSF